MVPGNTRQECSISTKLFLSFYVWTSLGRYLRWGQQRLSPPFPILTPTECKQRLEGGGTFSTHSETGSSGRLHQLSCRHASAESRNLRKDTPMMHATRIREGSKAEGHA